MVKWLGPRWVRIHTTFEPTEPERLFPFLHNFWLRLPEDGDIVIFDRSWYGRMLVELVENLPPTRAWKRAYQEIKKFESQLTNFGTVLIKFWIHITVE